MAWPREARYLGPVNILSQTTERKIEGKHISQINGIVRRVQEKEERGIIHHNLNMEELKLVVFMDSWFANNADLKKQLGFIILLADGTGRATVLHY